ncbi:MAG TPA: hypothetical protein VML55_26105 [Planctomycetaceae bacterium]|nr:hypothetical protein [Planctomycetaceae bacterium]
MTRCCRAAALAALIVCPLGCLGLSRQTEVLEARLRKQEDALYAIRSELSARNAELAAAHRELDMLHRQQAEAGQTAIPAEHVTVVSRATGIRFHSLLTRPLDRDDQPGPDVLNVVLTPHDADDETVKLPGSLRLELIDLSKPEGERTVAAWDFTPEQAREHWHSGFIATGYRFELPWPASAVTGNLLLLGRLTTSDGRHFDTTQPIVVREGAERPRVVERSLNGSASGGASDPAFEPTSTPAPGNAGAPGGAELPTLELPPFDMTHRKETDESAPATALPVGESPFILTGTELDLPVAAPRPPDEPAEWPAASGDPPWAAAPAEPARNPAVWTPSGATPAGFPPPDTWEPPAAARRPLPLPELERADRKAGEAGPYAAPLHRVSPTLMDGSPMRHFYPAKTSTATAPPIVLAPSDEGPRKAN